MMNLHMSKWAVLPAFIALAVVFLSANRAAQADEKPLSIREITSLRHDRVSTETIVERASDRGVSFAVTPAIENQLARLGFALEQIETIKQCVMTGASAEKDDSEAADGKAKGERAAPTVPGKGLPSREEERDLVLDQVTKITKLSGANLQSFAARHVTLWAGRGDQTSFLPDLKKIDKFLEGKYREPLQSGLDKRAAHLVLLKTRYDYEKWVTAMFEVLPWTGKLPDAPDGDASSAELRAAILKSPCYFTGNFVVICLEGQEAEIAHRRAATGVGLMNFMQQVAPLRHDPLATGLANMVEALVSGSPSTMIFGSSYQNLKRDLGNAPRTWLRLVQERMRTNKESSLRGLLQMDMTNMKLPHFAEAWTLVGLLAKQPEKFAGLVLALREEKETLKAIEDVYGWDEKKLEAEWRKDVLGKK